MNEKLFNVKLS